MVKAFNSKINHLAFIFAAKGIILIGLGIAILIYPKVLVWAMVAFIFLVGLASLFIAFKITHLKRSVLGRLPKFMK